MAMDNSIDIFLWVFETILGTIHVLMMIFLIAQRKRNKVLAYRSPFYVIFLWIGVFDLIYVINNDIGAKMPKYPALAPFFASDTYYPTAFYFITAYTSAFEISGHTILSINRYSAIKNAQINQACWSKQVKWVYYVLLFIAPMPTTVYRLFTPARYKFDDEGVAFIGYVDPNISKIVSIANMSYYTVNFVISLYATVRSCMNYRHIKKSKYPVNGVEKHELKLIIHSSVMFLLLVARCVYQITLLIGVSIKSTDVVTTAQFIFPIIASSYSLCGSSMLLVISEQVRYDFLEFYGRKKRTAPEISQTTEIQAY